MKRAFFAVVAVVMFLATLHGTLASDRFSSHTEGDFTVVWTLMQDASRDVVYIVYVMNHNLTAQDFDLRLIIGELDGLDADITLHEWKDVPQTFDNFTTSCSDEFVNGSFVEVCTTMNTPYGASLAQWKPAKESPNKQYGGDALYEDYGLISIPKAGSKPKLDEFGTVVTDDGTKTFRVTVRGMTNLLYSARLAFLVNSVEFHPIITSQLYNASWSADNSTYYDFIQSTTLLHTDTTKYPLTRAYNLAGGGFPCAGTLGYGTRYLVGDADVFLESIERYPDDSSVACVCIYNSGHNLLKEVLFDNATRLATMDMVLNASSNYDIISGCSGLDATGLPGGFSYPEVMGPGSMTHGVYHEASWAYYTHVMPGPVGNMTFRNGTTGVYESDSMSIGQNITRYIPAFTDCTSGINVSMDNGSTWTAGVSSGTNYTVIGENDTLLFKVSMDVNDDCSEFSIAMSNYTAPAASPPVISNILPADNYRTNAATMDFNYTVASYGNVSNCTVSMDGGVLWQTLLNRVDGAYQWMGAPISVGVHTWNVSCSDTIGVTTTADRTLTVDVAAPEVVLNADNEFNAANRSLLNQYDDALNLSMNFTDDYDLYAWNVTVNASNGTAMFSEENASLSGTLEEFFRGVNVSGWLAGWYGVNVVVSDSILGGGILNVGTYAWSWYRGTYNATMGSGTGGNPFEGVINITTDPSLTLNASFSWNGTDQDITASNGSDWQVFTVSFTNETVGEYWYVWTVNVTQDDGNVSQFTTANQTQTVTDWFLDECGGSTNTTTIRWDHYDEDVPSALLNGTAQLLMTYWLDADGTVKTLNHTYGLANNFTVCLSPANLTFYADIYLQNIVADAFTHRFYIQNGSFTDTETNYNIYNFVNQTGKSDMKLTTRLEDDYSYLENILVILQRQYVGEGVWRTVQMDRSGDYGLVFFNIIEETTDYRLSYYDSENNLLHQTTSIKFVCSGSVCDLTQLLGDYEVTTTTDQVTSTLTYDNDTGIITVVWEGPPTESHSVEFTATKETVTGPYEVCNALQVGSSGSFTCNVTGVNGQVFVEAVVDGESSAVAEWVDARSQRLGQQMSRAESSLWGFAIAGTILMVGIFSPVGAIISGIIGLIVLFFLGILGPLSITALLLSIVVGVAISLKVRT